MKFIYLTILLVLFSSCATTSEYGKGCRDGAITFISPYDVEVFLDEYCNYLEQLHERRLKEVFEHGKQ